MSDAGLSTILIPGLACTPALYATQLAVVWRLRQFLVGDQDALALPEGAKDMAKDISRAKLQGVLGRGHVSTLEQADCVPQALLGGVDISRDLLKASRGTISLVLTCCALAACEAPPAPQEKAATLVQTQVVALTDYTPVVVLTGEIRAQIETNLSFRVSGRITEVGTEVGSHVDADQVLAKIAPDEQQADVTAARAAAEAAQAEVRQTASAFQRQKDLLGKGFTTRSQHDQAEEAARVAVATLDATQAQLGTTMDALSFTELRAGVAGVIAKRIAEVGQVAQAAGTIFTLAQDGPRDAVFDVDESIFNREPVDAAFDIALVEDQSITAKGVVREVSPAVERATGTIEMKVGLEESPPRMTLGAPVTGQGRFKLRKVVILPWKSLTSENGQPAVWIVNAQSKAVSRKAVDVLAYETEKIIVAGGLTQGEHVVIGGATLLRPNQIVVFATASAHSANNGESAGAAEVAKNRQ